MKFKKYINVILTDERGNKKSNPLKFSEVYLISQMVRDGYKVEAYMETTSDSGYKAIFG